MNFCTFRTFRSCHILSSPAMADWSQLPKELLQLISQKLNSNFYILRFRSVCSTWRLSTPKPRNHFPLKLPHYSDYPQHLNSKLYNHNIFLIKPPATPDQQTLYRPWLLRISPSSTGKFNLWHPLDNYEDDYDSDDDYAKCEPVRIDVFRLDQREKKWVKLENLGDMVLFLGQGYSFAISASDLGFDNGNSVIYCNYNRDEMRVFPLDQQRTFLLSDYPDYFKLFWPPPEWIVSRCL